MSQELDPAVLLIAMLLTSRPATSHLCPLDIEMSGTNLEDFLTSHPSIKSTATSYIIMHYFI